jgi:uncharacterized RDD family membrane protein YckC
VLYSLDHVTEEQPVQPDRPTVDPSHGDGSAPGRSAVSSWLSAPRAGATDPGASDGYRGERLGYPDSGAGSVATMGRRLLAIAVDWLACYVVAWAGVARLGAGDVAISEVRLWNSVLFFVEVWLLTSLGGASFGQRLTRLRVQRLDLARLGPGRCLLRTTLIMLVIPAVIWDRDGRGLHDRAVDSVVVNTGVVHAVR